MRVFFPAYPTYQVFLAGGIALFITVFFTPLFIKILKMRNIGQVVRTDGPEQHLQKQGTPTMGGILILLAVTLAYFTIAQVRGYSLYGLIALGVTFLCGAIGFIDDYLKIIKVRSLGLKARSKLILEFFISIFLGYVVLHKLSLSPTITIPLLSSNLNLGIFYYLLVFLIVSGTANTVNLTDGLDGLAAGTVMIVSMAFAGIAFRQNHLDMAVLAAAIGGACVGFIWYNAYPAEIFMGDTGSLALGGAIASLAVLTKTELFLVVIGGIYVIEGLSVIFQVISFRYFGKRILKMAPLHHHFEMLGWSETKVMVRFWILTAFLAGYGFALYFITAAKQ